MSKKYEVLVKYYEAKRINIEVESESEIDAAVKDKMSNGDIGADMIIDYDIDEVKELNPMYDD